MIRRLTVRPKPFVGESLSSFFMRASVKNYVPYRDIYKLCTPTSIKLKRNTAHYLDTIPSHLVDIDDFAQLLGLSKSELHELTFIPVYEKFMSNICIQNFRSIMQDLTEKVNRRFCPVCLQDKTFYKTIWQVREVTFCNVHAVPLTSVCATCGATQPYLSDMLAYGRCDSCGACLSHVAADINNDGQLDTAGQLRIHNDWSFLLAPNNANIAGVKNTISIEKAVALKLLYISQGRPTTFEVRRTQGMTQDYANRIRRFINNELDAKWVSVALYLKLARNSGLSLEALSRLSVPPSYVKSVSVIQAERLGPCLAPWCRSYGISAAMRPCDGRRVFQDQNNSRYFLPTVCTDCFMKYGFRAGVWSAVGTTIEDIQLIIRLIKRGLSAHEIHRQEGVSLERIKEVIGYITYRGLCSTGSPSESCRTIPENISYKVKQLGYKLVCNRGRQSAKRLFNWSSADYYYFMATEEAQYTLSFDEDIQNLDAGGPKKHYYTESDCEVDALKSILVEMEASDTFPKYRNLSRRLNCSERLLRNSEPYYSLIKETVERFVRRRTMNVISKTEVLYIEQFLRDIGVSLSYLQYHYPDICKFITKELDSERKRRWYEKIEEYAAIAYVAVAQMVDSGHEVNLVNISERTGIPYRSLTGNPAYRIVREAINKAKLDYNIGHVINKADRIL